MIKGYLIEYKRRMLLVCARGIQHALLSNWNNYPFGRNPVQNSEVYTKLFLEAKRKKYPDIDNFEIEMRQRIDKEWFHDLALHTQIVVKRSELCYQHGRVLYSKLAEYINNLPESVAKDGINIWETGTARGFSALCMARALEDNHITGRIISFDLLPHEIAMFWNCIDDVSGEKTRRQLLKPWADLVQKYIIFVQGDSNLEMEKLTSNRINFAFLDGAHTYRDVRDEYRHIEKFQMSGDIIVYDDYAPSKYPGLTRAIDEVCHGNNYDCQKLYAAEGRTYVIATRL